MVNKYIEQAFIEMALFPACHGEDLSRSGWRAPQFFGPRQIERGERGIEMKIQHGFGAGLTVGEAGELFAVAKEKLDLAVTTHKTIDLVVQTQVKKMQRKMQK